MADAIYGDDVAIDKTIPALSPDLDAAPPDGTGDTPADPAALPAMWFGPTAPATPIPAGPATTPAEPARPTIAELLAALDDELPPPPPEVVEELRGSVIYVSRSYDVCPVCGAELTHA